MLPLTETLAKQMMGVMSAPKLPSAVYPEYINKKKENKKEARSHGKRTNMATHLMNVDSFD